MDDVYELFKKLNNVDDYKKIESTLSIRDKEEIITLACIFVKFDIVKYIYVHTNIRCNLYVGTSRFNDNQERKNKTKVMKWLFNTNSKIIYDSKSIGNLTRFLLLFQYNIFTSLDERIHKVLYGFNIDDLMEDTIKNVTFKESKKRFNFKKESFSKNVKVAINNFRTQSKNNFLLSKNNNYGLVLDWKCIYYKSNMFYRRNRYRYMVEDCFNLWLFNDNSLGEIKFLCNVIKNGYRNIVNNNSFNIFLRRNSCFDNIYFEGDFKRMNKLYKTLLLGFVINLHEHLYEVRNCASEREFYKIVRNVCFHDLIFISRRNNILDILVGNEKYIKSFAYLKRIVI
jgi:hypothetical protein